MARQDLSIKMDMEVVRKAKVVALSRNITLAQYLSDSVRPIVDKDYVDAVAKMAQETKGQKGGAK
jgi:hypothetical protein